MRPVQKSRRIMLASQRINQKKRKENKIIGKAKQNKFPCGVFPYFFVVVILRFRYSFVRFLIIPIYCVEHKTVARIHCLCLFTTNKRVYWPGTKEILNINMEWITIIYIILYFNKHAEFGRDRGERRMK